MKRLLQTATALALWGGWTAPSHAQTPVVSENFEGYATGSFGSNAASGDPAPIAAADTKTSSAVILGAEASGNKSKALQLEATLVSPGFNVAGISWNPAKQPDGKNTDKDLSHYTLSFDVSIIDGASFAADGLGLDVNILGQQTNTGASVSPDVTSVTAKGGFKHITITLDHNKKFLDRPTLDPTDQNIRLELNLVGAVTSETTEKAVIDNVQIAVAK